MIQMKKAQKKTNQTIFKDEKIKLKKKKKNKAKTRNCEKNAQMGKH